MIISGFCMQSAVFGLILTSFINLTKEKTNTNGDHVQSSLEEESGKCNFEFPQTTTELKDANDSNIKPNEEKVDLLKDVKIRPDELSQNGKEFGDVIEIEMDVVKSSSKDSKLEESNNLDNYEHQIESSVASKKGSSNSLRDTKWRFLYDALFYCIVIHMCTCTASLFSFTFMIMDFAKTKGFEDDSTGTFFFFVMYVSSMGGRLSAAVLGFVPNIHSNYILGFYGSLGSIGLVFLSFVTDYTEIIGVLIIIGVSFGGVIAINPRVVIDLHSVDTNTYALVLGATCSLEGFFDLIVPIIVGKE